MSQAITRQKNCNGRGRKLYLAFELGNAQWKLGFTVGLGQKARLRTIAAGDLEALEREIGKAKVRFELPASSLVMSCYEAGRDGFWLHRYLKDQEVSNQVVDSSSIEVRRRAKKVKTDRLDVSKLTEMLVRYDLGETRVWSVVRVPGVEEEDNRHLHRELVTLKRERTRIGNRIKGLLAGHGVKIPVKKDFEEQLKSVRLWDGSGLPAALHCRLLRELQRLELLGQQIRELEAERAELVREWQGQEADKVRQLLLLRGIGINSAWLYVMEFFSWRKFSNRRQLGSLAGLTPTPYQSGSSGREQGISKAGNRHIRAMAIELAWCWLRLQPGSQLSRWFRKRFGKGSARIRKIGVVAVARKLLIALWRYLETGEIPAGAAVRA